MREHGFMNPLALGAALIVCVALGYALVKGFSDNTRGLSKAPTAKVVGERLDAPLPSDELTSLTTTPVSEDVLFNSPYEEPNPVLLPTIPGDEKPVEPITLKQLKGGYLDVSFAKLSSYRYIFPEVDDAEMVPDQIPESIKKLNGKKVAVRGFMLPVRQKNGRITEFLLLKDQSMCCFGTMPGMNEWIHVIMKPGQSCRMVWDIPVTAFGTFEVGEVFENGVLMTIYRLQFDKLLVPEAVK